MKFEKPKSIITIWNERNLAETHRIIADRDRALIEGRAVRHTYEEENKNRETCMKKVTQAGKKRERWTRRALCNIVLLDEMLRDEYHVALTRPCQLQGKNFDNNFVGQARVSPLATRDTTQELEDITPTRGDYGLDSSLTSHRLLGIDRPGNINASIGRVGSVFGSNWMSFETLDSRIAKKTS